MMDRSAYQTTTCTAFEGSVRLASGDLVTVATAARIAADEGATDPVLVFDDVTGQVIDLDLRGSLDDVRRWARKAMATVAVPSDGQAEEPSGPRGPGRPRLGVVAREVTLLPRHWEWLNGQPGGASAALRRLVDEARRESVDRDRVRRARESAYRFMSAMAGNEPGFEEATRALFAGNAARFDEHTAAWPVDVRAHARTLAFGDEAVGRGESGGGS